MRYSEGWTSSGVGRKEFSTLTVLWKSLSSTMGIEREANGGCDLASAMWWKRSFQTASVSLVT